MKWGWWCLTFPNSKESHFFHLHKAPELSPLYTKSIDRNNFPLCSGADTQRKMQLPLLQSSDRNRWRTDLEGRTGNAGFAGASEQLLSTPSTPCGYLQPHLCSCGNGDRGGLLPPCSLRPVPQPSSTLSNLLTLWGRAEKDTVLPARS